MKLFVKLLLIVVLVLSFAIASVGAQEGGENPFADMTWDEIVAQAQEEGEVAWFQWYLQPRFREFVAAFEEEYGITVTVAEGSLDANMSKLIAESERETGDIDVLSSGFDRVQNIDIPSLFIPLDSIPGMDMLTTSFAGVDTMGYGLAWWGNQSGLAYRVDRLAEDELPQTFEELAAWMEAHPEEFAIGDPNGGGSGPAFLQAVIRQFGGDNEYTEEEVVEEKMADWEAAWEWLASQRGNFVISGGNADSLTRLNDGEFSMAPAWEDHLAGLQRQGEISEDVAFYIPEFGMNGGANVVLIPANAKNKAAAFVFVAWLTSAETQSALNQTFGSAPMHPEADDEFALVPNAQRAFQTTWFNPAYGNVVNQTFIERIMMGQ